MTQLPSTHCHIRHNHVHPRNLVHQLNPAHQALRPSFLLNLDQMPLQNRIHLPDLGTTRPPEHMALIPILTGRKTGTITTTRRSMASPTRISHSGCLGAHEFTLVSHTCLPHLSPTLVSHTCLPLWVLWAEFTLVSHLSPTLVSHTCLPHLSPTLGSLVRMYNIIENFYICLGSTLV